jgi:hypothetical protein
MEIETIVCTEFSRQPDTTDMAIFICEGFHWLFRVRERKHKLCLEHARHTNIKSAIKEGKER